MALLQITNNLDVSSQYSYLSGSYAAGGTSIPIKNSNPFSASWAIQIGATGEEPTEILILGTADPSGTVLNTTTTTLFNHPTDTPVYAIKYDKVIFKRSSAGTAGTATAIAGGTVSITPDSLVTMFDDTAGASTDAFKVAFYNSVLGTTSADSDFFTASGPSFYSLAKVRDRIKSKLFSASYIKEDSTIDDWINEWLETMNNTAIDVNQDYLLGTVDVSHGTAGLGTINSSDFKEIRRIWYTTDGQNYFDARKQHINDYEPDQTFSLDKPYFSYFGDNVIEKKPSGNLGTARIVYYKRSPVLTGEADELPVSMRSYTKSFVDYALSQAYYLDRQKDLGDRYYNSAQQELTKFRSEITPRSKTGSVLIDIVDVTDGDDGLGFF